MTTSVLELKWQTAAILIGRLIFAAAFLMAVSFKFAGMQATADYISAAGFPFSYPLAWLAAIFESVLVICFLTGAFFSEACLLAGVYVIFLAFAFHGPGLWAGNQAEFGFFVNHFTFLAGLLFAAANGPGRVLASHKTIIGKP
jgi:putative oxidoreductase